MNDNNKPQLFKIKDIRNIMTGHTRTDGRYPLRIGSTIYFFAEPKLNDCMYISYVADNQGNPKDGLLRTSLIKNIIDCDTEIIIYTMNSVYSFERLR